MSWDFPEGYGDWTWGELEDYTRQQIERREAMLEIKFTPEQIEAGQQKLREQGLCGYHDKGLGNVCIRPSGHDNGAHEWKFKLFHIQTNELLSEGMMHDFKDKLFYTVLSNRDDPLNVRIEWTR
jgi:hypothetical protein